MGISRLDERQGAAVAGCRPGPCAASCGRGPPPPRFAWRSGGQTSRARGARKNPAAGAPSRRSSETFDLPPVSVLSLPKASDRQPLSRSELDSNSRALEGVLGDFGVRGEIVKAHPGPVVTLYELEPAPGIKSSRVIGLADDIARSMSALSARVAVVPGRNAIGIELPNPHREKVYLRELL